MICVIKVCKGGEWGWLGEPGENPFNTPEWEARPFPDRDAALRECEMGFMAENYDEWQVVPFTPRDVPLPPHCEASHPSVATRVEGS